MVLLIPGLARSAASGIWNLHSTMVLLIQYAGLSEGRIHAQFTFHYGSTYTPSTRVAFTLSYIFTFHYGSTYTENVDKTLKTLTEIYIPLWFYLYQEAGGYYCENAGFTFHYGSTYTR